MSEPAPWRIAGDGVIVAVKVTPRASRDAVEGLVDTGDGRQALAVRVRVAPSDGAANEAVMRLLASAAGLPARAATLHAGGSARLKQIRLAGEPQAIAERLRTLVKEKTQ